ncbi:Prophage CP4-57 regulatory protein (AlpA) [Halomonas sp. THAF12]|uniref:helix-turn-helix transcriptional regulator n=1 Tax=Halomonas TaxID=2745 RepID=UPI00036167A1|nr:MULTISPECIES: AlpA family transcriptional regulator [Halomonas]QFT86562.1 Prophage CP4-57 regulatory protein (AlpA) [Halomonas sp. THAF12]
MTKTILLRRPEVLRRCAISNSTLHRLINAGNFPAPVPVGPRAVAWIESEINDWIEERIESRKGPRRELTREDLLKRSPTHHRREAKE